MKVHHHTVISLAIAGALFAVFRSTTLSAATLITGIFVDIDHGFDYLREYGLRFDLRFFFLSFNDTLYKKIVLLFHSWEWVALLAILSVASDGNPLVTGVLIGLCSHLLCDQFTNGVNRWGYFLLFRAGRKFVTSRIFPGRGLA